MEPSFLQKYLASFQHIEGWFSYDAALMFMAYQQLLNGHCAAGDVLEIGVHHGLSTIAVAALRGEGKRLVAIDLFEQRQNENISRSGAGDRAIFERNLRDFYPDLSFLAALSRASGEVSEQDVGSGFTFCHIDGGHSRRETHGDLCLCNSVSAAGGLIALDDYFNPLFPGVAEGAVEFMLRCEGALRPLAIGYNKVLFQKTPAPSDLNSEFVSAFPGVPYKTATMWESPVLVFGEPLRRYIDLYASTAARLVPFGAAGTRAVLQPATTTLRARRGERVWLPVSVANTSDSVFPAGARLFGVSYHLLSTAGETLVHDNDRAWITTPLAPGAQVTVDVPVQAPAAAGRYCLDIDLVWEGVMWFRDVGNPTARVELSVS